MGTPRKSSNFVDFWYILLYFRVSRVSPIDSARRDLSNGLGEMKIGDFFDFCAGNLKNSASETSRGGGIEWGYFFE